MKRQLKSFFAISLFLLVIHSISAKIDQRQWVLDNYIKTDYRISMRDSVKLYTVVYSPKDTLSSHPIIINRTPYSCGPYGTNDGIRSDLWFYLFPYLQKGYIVVFQDVRGKFMSEGHYENIRPFNADKKGAEIDEASDTYDTADWLVKHVKHNNGRIGVFGISYPGFYALMAGAANHPAIKAVSPQAPVYNWFVGDDFHHNGAFFVKDAFSFMDSFDQVREKLTQNWPKETAQYSENDYEFFKNKSLKELTDTYFPDYSRPFWSDLMNHPNMDDWWNARIASQATPFVTPAVMVVGGLFDAEDCYGAWNSYKDILKNNPKADCRIVEGPWYHGGWEGSVGDSLGQVRFDSKTSVFFRKNIEQKFFNHYLLGEKDSTELSGASIFFTGENKWHSFASWPLATTATDIFLTKGRKLSYSRPTVKESFSSYISDPKNPVPYDEKITQDRTREYMVNDQRFAENRKDVLTFETDALDKDVTVAGVIKADLDVAISTTDADFVVKVIDVFPEGFRYADRPDRDMSGYEMLVRSEVFRGRYRNSFSNPEAFVPGKPTEVNYSLPDIAHTFQKGHRIMVQIQSSWFPLVDMNPQQFINIYKCLHNDFIKSEIKVFHDAEHPSKLVLPVLENPVIHEN